jgi:adenosylhomocysteine nucleosidase
MNFSTLIALPLPEEMDAFLARLNLRCIDYTAIKIGKLDCYAIERLDAVLAIAGHGKTQFGIQTQYLIERLSNLKRIICVGAAGGIGNNINIFDTVVGSKTIEHDYRLRFVKRPEPSFEGNSELIQRALKTKNQGQQVHLGIIASGDEDIIELERANEIVAQTSAIAVAWEGAGGARASKFNQIPYLELRGITDTANNDAPVDFIENLGVAIGNIADLLIEW